MSSLDNAAKIKKLDQQNMLGSIIELPLQCRQAWQESQQVKLPVSYKGVKNIVINGMGGSGLGGEIIQFLFWEKLKLPLQVINSYTLPASVGKDTLYLVSSYSGNTEEVLGTLPAAKKCGAKIMGIATGGKLGAMIKTGQIPGYIITEKHNPCGQPRMGVGYSVFGQLGLLARCGVVKLSSAEVNLAIKNFSALSSKFGSGVLKSKNPAKQIAEKLLGRIPCLVVADFLAGNAHAFRNQFNENSKNFANYFVVSEMNHHLLEGLSFPKKAKKILRFLFIQSDLYYSVNRRRIEITKEVVESNGVDFIEYQLRGKTKLEQALELLSFGSYVNFYLAILNGVDPSPIPWVDYFKEQLGK